ncbi:hypothetical protein MA16_Dca001944 [Dendrobium catenatum]|uniref:Uncharacterized protein n=1 Tax=Dendrobium catenatum TaxID=906689 RepID=A0A2I0XDY8_9ASPA|nr:hypothetical protein MA16_Dca001944 [Dendrobium catenatum]
MPISTLAHPLSPRPASHPAVSVTFLVDQRKICGIIVIIISHDVDARAPLQRCKKDGRDAIANPRRDSINHSTAFSFVLGC